MLLQSLETLNEELRATILMVTHDAFTASYCNRILFIKDGKIFNELIRGEDSRKPSSLGVSSTSLRCSGG